MYRNLFSVDQLSAMAFQYVTLMSFNKKLQSRVPFYSLGGFSRVFVHILKLLIGSVRNSRRISTSKEQNCKSLCVTSSRNQEKNSFDLFSNDDEMTFLHYPGAKAYRGNAQLMGLRYFEYFSWD